MKQRLIIGGVRVLALVLLAVVVFGQVRKPLPYSVYGHQHCDFGAALTTELEAARQSIIDQGCQEIHEYHMVNDQWYVYGTTTFYQEISHTQAGTPAVQ